MIGSIARHRDRYAGGLVILIGLAVVGQASRYHFGSLYAMGSGFFPVIVGIALTAIGVLILAAAIGGKGDPQHDAEPVQAPDLRGFACIIAGILCFILLAPRFGMFPATFACVLVSACGDRTATPRSVLGLAIAVSVLGVAIFAYVLKLPLPAFRW